MMPSIRSDSPGGATSPDRSVEPHSWVYVCHGLMPRPPSLTFSPKRSAMTDAPDALVPWSFWAGAAPHAASVAAATRLSTARVARPAFAPSLAPDRLGRYSGPCCNQATPPGVLRGV